MRRLSMGDAESYPLDLFEAGEQPFNFDLVRADDLVNAVPSALRGRSNLRARVSKVLKGELGAVEHTRYTKGGRQSTGVSPLVGAQSRPMAGCRGGGTDRLLHGVSRARRSRSFADAVGRRTIGGPARVFTDYRIGFSALSIW